MDSDQSISWKLINTIILIRITMIFVPLNYDYPDEYWQGPQIAYKIYNSIMNNQNIGYETWQWTLDYPIRNPLYQFTLSLGYMAVHGLNRIAETFQQNVYFLPQTSQQLQDYMMELAPKAVQSILAILGDIYMVKILYFFYGKKQLTYSCFLFVMSNWFYLSMLSRTYINSFECVLMSVSLYYWLKHHFLNLTSIQLHKSCKIVSKFDIFSRAIVLIAYMARPTSLIPWTILWPYELCSTVHRMIGLKLSQKIKQPQKKYLLSSTNKFIFTLKILPYTIVLKIMVKNLFQLILMILCSFLLGSMYFGKPVLTEWNFFYVSYL